MALLGKRKATADLDIASSTKSRKQKKVEHAPIAQPTTRAKLSAAFNANKENIDSRPKRKRGDIEDAGVSAKVSQLPAKQNATPKSKRICKAMPPSPLDTPSRKTARLFDRLDLQNPSIALDTPPATPPQELEAFLDILPAPINDLINLHAALLSAVNNQTALDSSAFRLSLPDILTATRSAWRKRDVTIEDLRRIMAITNFGWTIEDFGRAGLSFVRQSTMQRNIAILDSNRMKRDFETTLRREYTTWQQDHAGSATDFVAQLSLASISSSDAVEKANVSKGKDRLDSIRNAQAAAAMGATSTHNAQSASSTNARGSNLLDRVLAKQAVMASLPAGPTKAQLERKSSLQRVEELARILDVLSSSRARASFSMLSVVQQIQQSLRSPMSRVEIERCLSIMATEVMPQFVSIVASGSVIGVVITRSGKPGFADLKKTLADIDV